MSFPRILSGLLTAITLMLASDPLPGDAAEANYDESKIPAYTLPDPLVRSGGSKVTKAADWPARRAEILALFEDQVYGRRPTATAGIKPRPQPGQTIADFLGGKATLREIGLAIGEGKDAPVLNLLLVTPNAATKPQPAFLALNFRGNHSIHPDPRISLSPAWMRPDKDGKVADHRATKKSRGAAASRWPLERLIDRGYALATIYYGDIDPDFDDDFANGVHALFDKPGPAGWGSIAAWAWGLSLAMDYLQTDNAIDASKVAVMGHSRLGKTSLWAGARDERFAIVISNNSGCGGAALNRRAIGETVARINTVFPHWFCDNFTRFNGNEGALPVDQHMLVALMAPRPVYVASAAGDRWADPKGEFLAAKHAEPVYTLLGKAGLGVADQPPVDKAVGDTIGYHLRSGKHDVTDYDWERYLDFADRHFDR